MVDRMQLNEQELDNVVGGAFNFFTNSKGNPRCNVTGHGNFDTTPDGFFKYITMRNSNPGLSEDDYFQMALDQHIIW